MEIYLVRHAIAASRDPERWPDDRGRPLTPQGESRFRKAARGLAHVVPSVDLVFSSPLARAWQTAEILQQEAGWPAPARWAQLEPDRPPAQAVLALAPHAGAGSVALVGHEPNMSDLASYLLAASGRGIDVEMKKGAVCCLSVDGVPQAGAAVLRFLLQPRVLRAL